MLFNVPTYATSIVLIILFYTYFIFHFTHLLQQILHEFVGKTTKLNNSKSILTSLFSLYARNLNNDDGAYGAKSFSIKF